MNLRQRTLKLVVGKMTASLTHIVAACLAALMLATTVTGSCRPGAYCRLVYSWRPLECEAHFGTFDARSTAGSVLKRNQRWRVGAEFATLQTIADDTVTPGDGATVTAATPAASGAAAGTLAPPAASTSVCGLSSAGLWTSPVPIQFVRNAAEFFEKHPQSNCTLDDLEVPTNTRWTLDKVPPASPRADDVGPLPDALRAAQLRNTYCALIRLTDPFDVLAHLWAASKAAAGRRGNAAHVPHPRIDLVGDASHRALFLRIVGFMRRQPYTVDRASVKVERMRYIVTTKGDRVEVTVSRPGAKTSTTHAPPTAAKDDAEGVLLEVNYVAFPDDSDVTFAPELSAALATIAEATRDGSLLLAVVGVAYVPEEACSIDSGPFAKGLLGTYRALHEHIDAVMPLDDKQHVTAAGAGVTLVSKGAHVPDLLRSDMVVKRNSYARSFMQRHRKPVHTVYVEPDETPPPIEHTLRRLGFVDLHQFLAPFLHGELGPAVYGKPARSTFACVAEPGTAGRGATDFIEAGACRDWMGLAVFQLLVNYVAVDNPQW
jgi:hypothetical protein